MWNFIKNNTVSLNEVPLESDDVVQSVQKDMISKTDESFTPSTIDKSSATSPMKISSDLKRNLHDIYDVDCGETNLEKKRELLEKVGAWRDSLNKAATFTGLVYKDGYESKFIINILNVVIKKVDNKALHIEEKLVGIKDNLAEIESWHKDLSTAFIDHSKAHSVGTLSIGDATELFSLHAFHQHQPVEPYIGQSELVVQHCKGLPLALKVLGSSLRPKTIDEWEDTICKLAAIPHPEIQEVLQISYEALKDDKDKDLFLHIACFFDVMMHQSIKEMGREVVRQESEKEPGKRSRLWQQQDCIDVLQDHSGTEKIEGLMLDKSLPKMKEVTSRPGFKKYFGKRLHGNDENFQISDISLEKLVVLDMSYSKLTHVWDDFKYIGSLKILNLSDSLNLIETPDFGGLPSLESLILRNCSSLIKVGKLITHLKKLDLLDITNCRSLRDLPCLPKSLKSLHMSGCLKLEVLGSIANLTELYSLDLDNCISLRDLPCLPKSLKSLHMSGCLKLEVLGSIANLTELYSLDLDNCISLRDLPCLLTSIESLEMSGCGVLERVQCLDSVSSLSLLKTVNLPRANLFDHSFPNEWSSLASLVKLYIDGNNITFLPKCVQTLPRIEELRVAHCSKLQSVLGLPKSVSHLFVNDNESLEKVQPAQNSRTLVYHRNCPKLCAIEGRYKIQSIDKVERKIIRYLGLESDAGEGMELDVKVFHEFGIFSTFVSEKQTPLSSSFTYRKSGHNISFKVPSNRDSSTITGFNICAVLSLSFLQMGLDLEIGVQNKTKDLLWSYFKRDQNIRKNAGKFALLSLWRCGNLLEDGDEIVIRVFSRLIAVEECCINLIYEDDEEFIDGERKEAHDVNAFDQMLWTDRMDKDISHYVFPGKKHVFRDDHLEYNARKEKWERPTISYPLIAPKTGAYIS
ncbi:unnamed protein product [Lactuca virosa]|uniref:C-JID domain-containing protein n=1 Tax=Lactuca virosa TaxID=75947 RepID=A0AAU9MNR8_9ASTR|nr:unnamed protein product [Lactuca virosa]